MYSIGVSALCAGVVCSTSLVSKFGNFAYKNPVFFTAHNVHSVHQTRKALAVVQARQSTLEQVPHMYGIDAVKPLGIGYPSSR